jgi:hypothetical protein
LHYVLASDDKGMKTETVLVHPRMWGAIRGATRLSHAIMAALGSAEQDALKKAQALDKVLQVVAPIPPSQQQATGTAAAGAAGDEEEEDDSDGGAGGAGQ